MNVMVVDDEPLALAGMTDILEKVLPDARLHLFQYEEDALRHMSEAPCDIVFLDIEMQEKSGIELADQMTQIYPNVNIIFVTAYEEYAREAFRVHASGYLLKPVTVEDVTRELAHLRFPVGRKGFTPRVKIQTFGNFEIFVDGVPIAFQYTKTKEMLAYLVDRRGSMVTLDELMRVLWNDESKKSYLKNLRCDLLQSLESKNCEDIIARKRGMLGVIPKKLDCDYYDWLAGKSGFREAFLCSYMNQYEWGEETRNYMNQISSSRWDGS